VLDDLAPGEQPPAQKERTMVRVIIEHQAKSPEDAKKVIAIIHEIRDEIIKHPGYITGETLINTEDECNIIVISTWHYSEHWEEWRKSEACHKLEAKEAPFLAKPLNSRSYNYYMVREKRVWSTF
jgi:heme-degrading monooxygenase HmoA